MDHTSTGAIKRQFGARLRAHRLAVGLSQEALGLICGLDRSYVGGIERGERNVSLVNIYRLAAGLNLSPQDLFDPPPSRGRRCAPWHPPNEMDAAASRPFETRNPARNPGG